MTEALPHNGGHKTWVRKLCGLLRAKRRPGLSKFLKGPSLRSAAEWGWEENINGICLGWRQEGPCLTFLVERKIAEARLRSKQRIPELLQNRELGIEIPTQVIEIGGRFQLQAPYSGTLRRGMAVGHEHGFPSGTTGFFVQRSLPGGAVRSILSCAHVLAWTRKQIFPLPKPGDFVEQPVSLDSDPEDFQVARLTSAFTDLTTPTVSSDFAVADIDPRIPIVPNGLIGVSGRSRPQDFPQGLRLQMLGRISGTSNATLRGVQAAVRIPTFGNVNFPFWQYQNVVVYDINSAPGDSGGGITELDTGLAVGLHVGGGGALGLFYPLRPIFNKFELSLLP